MKKIYIAGPLFSSGMVDDNIRNALLAAEWVRENGGLPLVPHLYFFWDMISPHKESYWLELDEAWVGECDAVLRLPGNSSGADKEEQWAKASEKPVFAWESNLEREALLLFMQPWWKQ